MNKYETKECKFNIGDLVRSKYRRSSLGIIIKLKKAGFDTSYDQSYIVYIKWFEPKEWTDQNFEHIPSCKDYELDLKS